MVFNQTNGFMKSVSTTYLHEPTTNRNSLGLYYLTEGSAPTPRVAELDPNRRPSHLPGRSQYVLSNASVLSTYVLDEILLDSIFEVHREATLLKHYGKAMDPPLYDGVPLMSTARTNQGQNHQQQRCASAPVIVPSESERIQTVECPKCLHRVAAAMFTTHLYGHSKEGRTSQKDAREKMRAQANSNAAVDEFLADDPEPILSPVSGDDDDWKTPPPKRRRRKKPN